jgi:hypothetical protein
MTLNRIEYLIDAENSHLNAKCETCLMLLRIDVDYPYPSRFRSFIHTALGIKFGNDYLKNSKILARMINESPKKIKVYWFFTFSTIPDRELFRLLDNEKHEIALHVVKNPEEELKKLEKSSKQRIHYYTIHGTARLLGRVIWGRWKSKTPWIPSTFRLKSFHDYKAFGLDGLCFTYGTEGALKKANSYLENGKVLYFHPIWLFQKGKLNHRGPFYRALKTILDVDNEFEDLHIRRRFFFKIARNEKEYEKDIIITEDFVKKLGDREVDIFSFVERKWSGATFSVSPSWTKTTDNVALLHVTSYDEWWKSIGKKTRNMIRKSERKGILIQVTMPCEKLANGIWKIYNETPIRQERAFPHYGVSLQSIRKNVLSARKSTFIVALFQNEIVGFIKLVHGDDTAIISQILSLQEFWDKAVNNALLAKAVEVCSHKAARWIMYGRMGNHPSLDRFKQSNGFEKFPVTRCYVPITKKGQIAIKLRLHREAKDVLPQRTKYWLIPFHNWVSRSRVITKRYFGL